ncbi:SMI1/KNR4 family protein [Pseudomonas syringae group genomosp. 3]|uniref:SMI1/KNR4 family protein n=1 Tax=Pseudomonas syringae group genomosp. 3 TaxID=251701 RepID=UPI0005C8A7EF|nr:SMI1/KNR4 family protein [Pseudomonas syringae group genomosp. 3]
MANFNLSKCDPNASSLALSELESTIDHTLPDSFKEFYIKHNGGIPNKDWWDSDDDHEPLRVKRFKAVAPENLPDTNETRLLGGCYITMTEKDVIPKNLLPFAIDDGGNFFCLDLIKGAVGFYATDSFDSKSSIAINQAGAYRWLASSFEQFIAGLKDEGDIDL